MAFGVVGAVCWRVLLAGCDAHLSVQPALPGGTSGTLSEVTLAEDPVLGGGSHEHSSQTIPRCTLWGPYVLPGLYETPLLMKVPSKIQSGQWTDKNLALKIKNNTVALSVMCHRHTFSSNTLL